MTRENPSTYEKRRKKEDNENGGILYKDWIFVYIPNPEIGDEMPPLLDFSIEKESICLSPLIIRTQDVFEII